VCAIKTSFKYILFPGIQYCSSKKVLDVGLCELWPILSFISHRNVISRPRFCILTDKSSDVLYKDYEFFRINIKK
jgi:hypothetical protein